MGGVDKEGHKNKKRAHVLFIAHPSHGHIISAVLLSKQLVQQGIRVTFICHKPDIDSLLCDEGSELHSMDLLQFVGLPRPNVVTESPMEASVLLEKSFEAANMLDQLSSSEGPTCILSDMFIYWSTDLALQLHIPRYTFIPSGAVLIRFLQASEELFIQGTLRATADDSPLEMFDGQINVPGLPALRYHELPVTCRCFPLQFKIAATNIMAASSILMNTFYELEASQIDMIRNLSPIKGQKFYPVGPLCRTSNSLVKGLDDSKEQCIRWLDTQPDSSVLYICFGTLFRLKPVQIQELVIGLERSKHRFLLALPDPTVSASNNVKGLEPDQATSEWVSGCSMLPPGFEARVTERGYIVEGWAPQVQVLSHPAAGGFLSHCGWNSCLEAVISGVSVLAWPISADQHINCRYLVDELKVASEVQKGADGIMQQEEVERAVRLFMEDERLAMSGRMEVLKQKAATALSGGGSSTYALQQFAQDIQL